MKSVMLASVILGLAATAALADGDAAKGEKVFKQCKACHELETDTNKVGPTLKGVIGRNIASVAGFNYSDAMKTYATTNPVWTDELFEAYITDPKKAVPGNKMSFAGVKKEDQRDDLLACGRNREEINEPFHKSTSEKAAQN